MRMTEKTVCKHTLYEGRILTLRSDEAQLPDGRPALREVVEHPGGVCIAALTGQRELLLVRQYRYPFAEETVELPAGKLDGRDADPFSAAQRELREETGAIARTWRPLGRLYPTPGFCTEVDHLYLATDLTFGDTAPDDDEFLELLRLPLSEAVGRVMRGDFPDAKTQIGILKVWTLAQTGEL
ncbi:MAG: NUDIX hydrolase [Clostridia bacterium]|nr:NUDIX hydrolase [Clostridia bacterium]